MVVCVTSTTDSTDVLSRLPAAARKKAIKKMVLLSPLIATILCILMGSSPLHLLEPILTPILSKPVAHETYFDASTAAAAGFRHAVPDSTTAIQTQVDSLSVKVAHALQDCLPDVVPGMPDWVPSSSQEVPKTAAVPLSSIPDHITSSVGVLKWLTSVTPVLHLGGSLLAAPSADPSLDAAQRQLSTPNVPAAVDHAAHQLRLQQVDNPERQAAEAHEEQQLTPESAELIPVMQSMLLGVRDVLPKAPSVPELQHVLMRVSGALSRSAQPFSHVGTLVRGWLMIVPQTMQHSSVEEEAAADWQQHIVPTASPILALVSAATAADVLLSPQSISSLLA